MITRKASLAYVALAALTACGGNDAPGAEAASLDEAVVLFERRDSAGSVLLKLDRALGTTDSITGEGRNWSGRISPDGRRLLYVSLRDGNYEIYVSDADGGGARRITDHPDYDVVGAWSPDGRQVAFMSTRGFRLGGDQGPFPGHVYIASVDGPDGPDGPDGLRQVTREPLTSSLGPTDWSPNGRWLTIAREVDGQVDVFLLDVETGEERRVTSHPSSEYGATFSSDGQRLAFHADDGAASRIVVTDLDGSNRRALTPPDQIGYSPIWSPDDNWLLYTRRGEGTVEQYDVAAVRAADGVVTLLVATPVDERAADWGRPGR